MNGKSGETITRGGFDALLALGLKAAVREEWEAMAAEAEKEEERSPASSVSPELDGRVRGILAGGGKRAGEDRRGGFLRKYGPVFAAAALCLLFLLSMTVRPIRLEIARVLMLDPGETYRFSTVLAPGEVRPETLAEPKEPGFVPEGLEKTEVYRTPYAFGVVYADGDGRRIFYNQHVLPEDPVDMVDENPNVRPVEIGGHSGAVFTDPKGITFNLLIWTDGAYFYTLDGTADGETLIRMAESLRGSPASAENGREEGRS